MTNDELRALADALEPMAKAPRFEDMNVPAFCRWLRACADAQPVAWRCEVRGDGTDPKLGAVDWRHYHTTTSKREAQAFVARCGNGIEGRAVPLYPHAAAPQPEPKRPAFLDEIDRAKEHVASWPQWMKDATVSAAATLPVTEPKREPLSDERIDEIGDPFGYFQYGDAQGDKRRAFARAVERAAYERAAQECDPHEDDDRIDRQIKREIADRIRALGRQHD